MDNTDFIMPGVPSVQQGRLPVWVAEFNFIELILTTVKDLSLFAQPRELELKACDCYQDQLAMHSLC